MRSELSYPVIPAVPGIGAVPLVLHQYISAYTAVWQVTAILMRAHDIPAQTFLAAGAQHNISKVGGLN